MLTLACQTFVAEQAEEPMTVQGEGHIPSNGRGENISLPFLLPKIPRGARGVEPLAPGFTLEETQLFHQVADDFFLTFKEGAEIIA